MQENKQVNIQESKLAYCKNTVGMDTKMREENWKNTQNGER